MTRLSKSGPRVSRLGPGSRGRSGSYGAATIEVSVGRLNVFGPNVVARQLYASLGYEITSQNMAKRLD